MCAPNLHRMCSHTLHAPSLLPSAFGFCEYKEPESTLRALRLLHELQVGEKKLLVKVDAKTKAQLDEWKAKKKGSSENGVSIRDVKDDSTVCFHFLIDVHLYASRTS